MRGKLGIVGSSMGEPEELTTLQNMDRVSLKYSHMKAVEAYGDYDDKAE